MTKFNFKNEVQGVRNADTSGRFRSHPASNVNHSIMEPVDNMLIYGLNKGEIEIIHDSRFVKYRFYNNCTEDKVPTEERLLEILKCAGASISAKEKTSTCGMGIEVFALEARPYPNATTYVDITVNRNGYTYAGKLTYCGADHTIKYQYFPPQKTRNENSFEIIFSACDCISDRDIREFKAKICEKLFKLDKDRNFSIKFKIDKNEEYLKPCDALYEDILKGTKDFMEKTLYYNVDDTMRPMIIKMANVSGVGKSDNSNYIDKITSTPKKMSPNMSGFRLVFGDMITVQGNDIGWNFVGKSKHSTLNGIRGNIEFPEDYLDDKFIFNQIHSESLVKCDTTVTIDKLEDEFQSKLTFYDESGKEVKFEDVITPFLTEHASDNGRDDTELENIFKNNESLQNDFLSILNTYFTTEQLKNLCELKVKSLVKWSTK